MNKADELQKQIKMDIDVRDYITTDISLFSFSSKSKKSHNIGELARKYGEGPPKFLPETFEVMKDTGRVNRQAYEDVSNNPMAYRSEITSDEVIKLKEYAKSLGVNDIGFSSVDSKLIFKDRSILHDNAIVLTIEMDHHAIALAPSRETGHEVHRTYNKLGKIAVEVAKFLRTLGFSAQAGPALGGDVDYRHLAQKAGLGAIGNHGLLISPLVGPRQRITAVYTSIENFDYVDENTHEWVRDYCSKCKLCSKRCPGSAIKGIEGAKENNEYIDMPKCAKVFSTNFGCSVCIKECIFNKLTYATIHDSYLKQRK